MKTIYTQSDIMNLLRKEIDQSSQTQVARRIGVKQPFITKLLNGTRHVSECVADAYGFERERTLVFRKKPAAKALVLVAMLALAGMCGCGKKREQVPTPVVIKSVYSGTTSMFVDCPTGWMPDYDHDLFDDDRDINIDVFAAKYDHLHCRHEYPRERERRAAWVRSGYPVTNHQWRIVWTKNDPNTTPKASAK